MPEKELERYPEIPWRSVKAMGNILRHEYHHLDDKIIWDVVHHELPELRAILIAANLHLFSKESDG